MDIAYTIGVLIGAIITGLAIGAAPLICGIVKKKVGLAIGGLIACVVGHFLLGLLLFVPICIVFLLLIFLTGKKKNEPEENNIYTA